MARIFISYSRSDGSELANELSNRLRAQEHQVFFDVQSIRAGTHWRQELSNRIKWADMVVVLVTPGSNDSDYVYDEISEAARRGKTIIPVRVQDTPLPVHLRGTWQAIVFEGNNYDALLLEIERTLQQMKPSRRVVNPTPLLLLMGLAAIVVVTALLLGNGKDDDGDRENPDSTLDATDYAELTVTAMAAPTLLKLEADQNATATALELAFNQMADVATSQSRDLFQQTQTAGADSPPPTPTRTPRPTSTPRPSPTSTPSSTPIPEIAILYREDFADSKADGFDDQTWTTDRFKVVDDGTGNRVWQGSGHPEVVLDDASIDRTENYGISLRFYFPNEMVAFGLGVREDPTNTCRRYHLHIDPAWSRMEQVFDSDCHAESFAPNYGDTVWEPFQANRWYQVWIEVRDTSMRWRFDDGPIYEVTDTVNPVYRTGTFGIDIWGNMGSKSEVVWIDDIVIWSLDED